MVIVDLFLLWVCTTMPKPPAIHHSLWGLTRDHSFSSSTRHVSFWYPSRYIPRMCPSTHSTSTLKRSYLYLLLPHHTFQIVHFTYEVPFQVIDRLQNKLKRPLQPLHYTPPRHLSLHLPHSLPPRPPSLHPLLHFSSHSTPPQHPPPQQ
ncbi:hypothetical protein GWK47_039031 [Chionoecetes opilio]|uniref:Uncharacterized protein n=1 Tax=Chionoecetes opilio TaxID=41210 RepID=A0A8J4YDC1_CHIOP|nr:hypothetical protein GWK47_039031 [Chionoecetes opilio]